MQKYQITLTEDQMRLIADCLEDISRFACGQPKMQHTIDSMLDLTKLDFDNYLNRKNGVESCLIQAKKILLPELTPNESYGYNSTDFIGNTYQIYRSILHRLAVDNNWNNVYSSTALPSGNMGTIKIEKVV